MLAFVAVLCSGVFAGAAIYISIAQHPAALAAGQDVATRFFPEMYRRASRMQAALAAVGALAAFASWGEGGSALFLLGGLLLGASIPITLVWIKPINDRLLDPALDRTSQEAAGLLEHWGRLHATRSATSGIAFVCLLLGG